MSKKPANMGTGVDDLLDLINQRRSVEIQEAARMLSATSETVEDWAEAMSDQGLIEIDYGFGKVTLKAIAPATLKQKELAVLGSKNDVSKKATSATERATEVKKQVTYTAKDLVGLEQAIEAHGKEAEQMMYEIKNLFAEGDKFIGELEYRKVSAEQREHEMSERFESLEKALHASEKRLSEIIREFGALDSTLEDIFKRARMQEAEVKALEGMKSEITRDMQTLEKDSGVLLHYKEKVNPSVLETLKRLVSRLFEKLEYVMKKKLDIATAHKEIKSTLGETREKFGIEKPAEETPTEQAPEQEKKPEFVGDEGEENKADEERREAEPDNGEEGKGKQGGGKNG